MYGGDIDFQHHASLRVVKYQSHRVSHAASNPTHTMAHDNTTKAPFSYSGTLIDGENHGVPLTQRDDLHTLLASRCTFSHHELAAEKILTGLGQQDRDLQWKNMLAVEVLMQTVVVALSVLQHQWGRTRLPGVVTAAQEIIQLIRIPDVDIQLLIPLIGCRYQATI